MRPEFSHFLSGRQGIRADFDLRTGRISLFGEIGDDEFEPLSESFLRRVDDVEVLGAELKFEIRNAATLTLHVTRTEV